jgi:ketosteroid isomerase-like protein
MTAQRFIKRFPMLVIFFALLLMIAAPAASKTKKGTLQAAASSKTDAAFAAAIEKLRNTWVQEFNAGHADKVAALYSQDAVMMRWDGSMHGRDSILALLQKSIGTGAHDYTVNSLHSERSGDLGYDSGAYNVTLRDRVVEGNYLIVVKNVGGKWWIVAHAAVPNPREK